MYSIDAILVKNIFFNNKYGLLFRNILRNNYHFKILNRRVNT